MNKFITPENMLPIVKRLFLLFAFLCLLTVSVSAEVNYYYSIELHYDRGDVSYTTLTVIPSEKNLKTPGSNYIAEIIGPDNRATNITFFGIPTELLYDSIDPETGEIIGGGRRILNESEINLYLPYSEHAQRINIYNLSLAKKLTIPIVELSREATLPEVAERVPPETLKETLAERFPELPRVLWGVLLGVGIIFAIVLSLAFLKKRRGVK